MNWSDVDRSPSPRKLRQFAALWLVVLVAIAAWRWNAGGIGAAVVALASAGVAGGLIGLVVPAALRPLFVGLTILSFPIGWLVSRLILAIVFYGVVTPIALVMRLLGRDALGLRTRKESYWTEAGASKRMPSSYLRQS